MIKNEKSINKIPLYPSQADFERNLPKTVQVLNATTGSKAFVVGTVHFSRESQDDVSVVIRNTKPAVVMLELCPLRKHILEMDEKTLFEEASSLDSRKVRDIITSKGLINGMFYVSFLRTNALISKQLGVAPGGELRRAVKECKMLNNCKIILGDRPIDITMQRALAPLNWKEKLKLSSVFNEPSYCRITPADIEAYKNRDVDYLKNLRDKFPSVYRSFVIERDKILAHNLMLATQLSGNDYCNVVGVVGMGHMNGICDNFEKTRLGEIKKIMRKDLNIKKGSYTNIGKILKLLKLLKYR